MTNITKITNNEALVNLLDEYSVMDSSDNQFWIDPVETLDTVEDFKKSCVELKSEEVIIVGDVKVTILHGYQKVKGAQRCTLIHVDYQDNSANHVFIN